MRVRRTPHQAGCPRVRARQRIWEIQKGLRTTPVFGAATPARAARALLTAAVGALAVVFPAAALAQSLTYSGTNVTGALVLARVVNLRQAGQSAGFRVMAARTGEVVRPLPPRLTPPGVSFPAKAAPLKLVSSASAGLSGGVKC